MGRVLVALLTLIVAGGVGVAVLFANRPAPPPPQIVQAPPPRVVPKVTVLVAARPVRAGALLQPEDMTSAPISEDQLPPGTSPDSLDTRTALRGAMVRESLEAGSPIAASQVLRPGDRGFLAAVLAPGTRAVSVAVDSVSGTAGLIWPGDRVDLILTQAIDDAAQPLGKRVVGECVLRDVRVIAVDQQLMEGGQQSQPQAGTVNNRVLTLEVAPAAAERVSVAMRLGRLAAVVRSAVAAPPSDQETTGGAKHGAQPGVVWADDVSTALRTPPPARLGGELRVFRASAQPATVKF
jgi:pilus assembly protein CpaB